MNPNSQHLTLRIAKLKKAIRRKYNSFKTGIIESEKFFENKYKPIITQIKKTSLSPKEEILIKTEPKIEGDDIGSEDESFIPQAESSPRNADLDTLLSTSEGRYTVSRYLNDHFDYPLTKQYMELFMRDKAGKASAIDHLYGPRYDDSENLMVGDKTIDFNKDGSIIINGIRYKGTEGLYELIFKRIPGEYTESDLRAYKDILIKTNAHKKDYKITSNINRNSSLKYKNIISKLFPVEKKGSGMQWKSSGTCDIVHWDDPNELVDRLRLLVMSVETGNNSHTNEIINIVEELREGGFIKGNGNMKFKTLLK